MLARWAKVKSEKKSQGSTNARQVDFGAGVISSLREGSGPLCFHGWRTRHLLRRRWLLLYGDYPENTVPREDYRIIGTKGNLREWISRQKLRIEHLEWSRNYLSHSKPRDGFIDERSDSALTIAGMTVRWPRVTNGADVITYNLIRIPTPYTTVPRNNRARSS